MPYYRGYGGYRRYGNRYRNRIYHAPRANFGMYQRKYRRADPNTLDNRISVGKQRDTAISDRQIVKMNYVDSRGFSGSGPLAYRQFNLNSIFDPDRTGIGHQPLGRDQWATFYNRYRVFAVDYEVVALSSTSSNVPQVLYLEASNDTTAPTTLSDYLEQSETSQFKSFNSNTPPAKLKGTINLPALLGETKEQFRTSVNNQALMTADPANFAILNVIVASVDGTSTPVVYLTVKLTYHVELFDRFDLAQS